MKEIIDLLKEQNRLTTEHNNLVENTMKEFKRILQLQAAEAKVGNARAAMIFDTLEDLVGNSQKLLDEFNK